MTLEYHSSLQLRDVTSSSYLSLPAAEKVDRLWSNCLSDTKPAPWPSTMTTGLGVTFLQSMCPSLITPGDELPAGRRKLIHPVGVVGRVEWRDKGGHPYTGIFKALNTEL